MINGDDVIGFIGLGQMGLPIAARLLDAGVEVVVWNRNPAKGALLVELGAEVADSIADLVERSDIVLLCVTDTAAVEDVVFGEEGVAAFGSDDQILVDLSSIEPGATRRFARELDQGCGMAWVDAPVAGDVSGAEAGTLVVTAGGHEEDIERVRPLLEMFSQRVTRMGDVGAGQTTKLCHQMLVGCNLLMLGEVIAFAERSGVDAERIPGALGGGLADSLPLQLHGPRMAVRLFEPALAGLGTLGRDLDTAVGVARDTGAAVPLAALATQLLRQHALRSAPDQDVATLIELYSE